MNRTVGSVAMPILLFAVSVTMEAQTTPALKERLPQSWNMTRSGASNSLYNSDTPVDDKWWTVFGDTTLNALVADAMTANYSLLTAVNNIELAAYTLRSSRGNLMPSLSFSAGWDKEQTSGSISEEGRNRERYFSSGLSLSWDADLFGSIRRRVKSDKAALLADVETHSAVMISLAAQVASAYINLREAQQTLKVIERNCESQKAILRITEARFNAGLASKLDVSQAKSVYYSTRASLPQAEINVNNQITTIAVLLGTYPDNVRSRLSKYIPMPEYVELVSVGVPADLLRRRPDVRSAERQVAVRTELLGASKADILPKLYLNASAGYSAKKAKRLFDGDSFTYEIAPSLSWTLFNGGKSMNAIGETRVELREAVEQFNQTVVTAMQEADNALCAYSNSIKEMVTMREVCHQGKETLTLSLELYKQGLSPFQNVLDAQRSLLSYESTLVQSHATSLLQLIALYKALGGGWMR